MKKYLVYIKDKDNINIYIRCNDIKEVEEKLFQYTDKLKEFDIYSIIKIDDVITLTELALKRLKKSK